MLPTDCGLKKSLYLLLMQWRQFALILINLLIPRFDYKYYIFNLHIGIQPCKAMHLYCSSKASLASQQINTWVLTTSRIKLADMQFT